jgi:hypothetical protein
VRHKDHAAVAELVNLVVQDKALRARIIQRQRERWPQFTPNALRSTLQSCLETIE